MKTHTDISTVEHGAMVSSESHEELSDVKTAVLILDHDAPHRGHLRELVEQEGLEPATFADAYRMVRYVEHNRARVKALFIDARIFPAIAETLTSMAPGPGARLRLILTGVRFEKECVRRWIDKGVYACVRKPFSSEEISAFLR